MTPGIYKKGEKDDNPEARDDLVHEPLTLPESLSCRAFSHQDVLDIRHFSFAGIPQFVKIYQKFACGHRAYNEQTRLYWILVRRSWPTWLINWKHDPAH